MIHDRTIICFASGYDAPPTSKHHVMHLLAEHNEVLWINYHASRMPGAAASDVLRIFRKLGQVFRGSRQVRRNLHVLTPLVLPLPGSRLARHVNRRLLLFQINRALARLPRRPRQIWSFAPDVSYLVGRFDEERVLYYCVDDFASFSGYDRNQVLRDEADLCRKADLVITTSAALQEAKSPLCRRSVLVRHGVDYAHFSRAVDEPLEEPHDISAIPHPRLGFFGLLHDWVDLDLPAEVARRRPGWHFVIIGDFADSSVDQAPYIRLKNMHLFGRKPYSALPDYCKYLDVALIPFRLNELTRAVNPIKLHEYLAAGLPVVSTALPEVVAMSAAGRLADSIFTANDADGFEQAIAAALEPAGSAEPAEPGEKVGELMRRRRRSAAMADETWQAKLNLISQTLDEPATSPASL